MPSHNVPELHPQQESQIQFKTCSTCQSILQDHFLSDSIVCTACKESCISYRHDLAPSRRSMQDFEDRNIHITPPASPPNNNNYLPPYPKKSPPLSIPCNSIPSAPALLRHHHDPPISSAHSQPTPSPPLHQRATVPYPDPLTDITRLRVRPRGHQCLYPGAEYQGTQKSGRNSYEVNVTIVDVNFPASTLCGYLRIRGLTDDWPELTTYFDAEIIGSRYGFLTQHWGATTYEDMIHWSRFPAFKNIKPEANRPHMTIDDRDRGVVFMRWKERFLVPDHRVHDINGASFAGFYYVCVDFNPPATPASPTISTGEQTTKPTSEQPPPASKPEVRQRSRRDSSARRRGAPPTPFTPPIATMNGFYYHQNSEPLAGIIAAIELKEKLNFHDFTIFERADSVGGTWRDNTYPGCGSDVPGHWYSYSRELNPNWDTYYIGQPQLRVYWEHIWHKHNLVKHTRLNSDVTSAEWSNETQRYTVSIMNVKTGTRETVQANAMFYAIGGFQEPLYPDLPGIRTFKGGMFHSARWNHDVVLAKKRVGVIGNGCSAAQLVPQISKDPSVEVINFCRTPQWYIRQGNYRYPKWIQWMFAHIPFLMRIYRSFIMLRSDISFLLFRKNNKRLLKIARSVFAAYIRKAAPRKDSERLIPDYSPGCKRIIVDPGYLKSLHRPNVNLNWDGIEAVLENGVRMTTGEIIPLDVIIFGTGYSIEPASLHVKGSKGTTLHEYFASKGGPVAYLGSCMPGFPNLFTLLGPNVASGHASVIFSEEAQVNFALQLIKPVLDGQAKSFEITDKATDEYNDWLQRRLSTSVWTDCMSYYQRGRNDSSRVIATFPGPVALFWWFCRYPRWEMFWGVGSEKWEAQRKRTARMQRLVVVVVVVLAGIDIYNRVRSN